MHHRIHPHSQCVSKQKPKFLSLNCLFPHSYGLILSSTSPNHLFPGLLPYPHHIRFLCVSLFLSGCKQWRLFSLCCVLLPLRLQAAEGGSLLCVVVLCFVSPCRCSHVVNFCFGGGGFWFWLGGSGVWWFWLFWWLGWLLAFMVCLWLVVWVVGLVGGLGSLALALVAVSDLGLR